VRPRRDPARHDRGDRGGDVRDLLGDEHGMPATGPSEARAGVATKSTSARSAGSSSPPPTAVPARFGRPARGPPTSAATDPRSLACL
jgi:hypothetical protein